ncbi:hypothetical protein TorRG33x02_223620 [Trema orientale]|uniref:Uncharacterized protein n=1 Tax=Trema orientale TaxID=63057 RepID=A0A2P5E8I8_TREOI|nr:hypothetical protein TorRG33x02_223620 [Trema orientale]
MSVLPPFYFSTSDSQNLFSRSPTKIPKYPASQNHPLPNAKLSASDLNLNHSFSSNGHPSSRVARSLNPPKPTKPNPHPPHLVLPPLYHPRELAELARSQRQPTKVTSVGPEASTSATSSSGHAYISSSNYKDSGLNL